jgi:methyl-accepting chemotaxis protein
MDKPLDNSLQSKIEDEIRQRREKLALRYVRVIFWAAVASTVFFFVLWLLDTRYKQFEMLSVGILVMAIGSGVCLYFNRRGQITKGIYIALGAWLLACAALLPLLPELTLTFLATYFLVALFAYLYLGAARISHFAFTATVLLTADIFVKHFISPQMTQLLPLDPLPSFVMELSVVAVFFEVVLIMRQIIAEQDNTLREQLLLTTNIDQRASDESARRQALEATVQKYTDFLDRWGSGDLTAKLEISGAENAQDPLVRLGVRMKAMAENQKGTLLQIRDASTQLSAATSEILAATTQQASSASQQSTSIAETAATFEEVKAISSQFIHNSQDVVASSQHSAEFSRSGEAVVEDTLQTMEQVKAKVSSIAENILALSERTQQVGEIITTVNQIAAQSNILALNAAIEASRAGDQGVGFAVVATEVRSLAEQSKRATTQVQSILTDIQKAINNTVMVTEEGTKVTESGLTQAKQAGLVIQQLVSVIDQASIKANQMLAGGRQQTTGIDDIAMAMQNIKLATQQSLASTRQTERAAQDLNLLAQSLMENVTRYKLA